MFWDFRGRQFSRNHKIWQKWVLSRIHWWKKICKNNKNLNIGARLGWSEWVMSGWGVKWNDINFDIFLHWLESIRSFVKSFILWSKSDIVAILAQTQNIIYSMGIEIPFFPRVTLIEDERKNFFYPLPKNQLACMLVSCLQLAAMCGTDSTIRFWFLLSVYLSHWKHKTSSWHGASQIEKNMSHQASLSYDWRCREFSEILSLI